MSLAEYDLCRHLTAKTVFSTQNARHLYVTGQVGAIGRIGCFAPALHGVTLDNDIFCDLSLDEQSIILARIP